MKILSGSIPLMISTVMCFAPNAAFSQSVNDNIVLKSFKATYPSAGKIKLQMSAAGQGNVKVGSYVVFVSDVQPVPQKRDLAGMELVKNTPYVTATDFKGTNYLLKDNGGKDEDRRKGYFGITLDTRKWPPGSYEITIRALNLPNPGAYFSAAKTVSYNIGSQNQSLARRQTNIPGAKNVVIYKNKNVYACFPSLIKLEDGRLLTGFSTRKRASHIDAQGGGKRMLSADGGLTWQPTDYHYLSPDSKSKDGKAVIVNVKGWEEGPENRRAEIEKKGIAVTNIRKGVIAWQVNQATVGRSTDGGKNWKTEKLVVPDDVADIINFSSFRSSAGIRLQAVYGKRKVGGKIQTDTEIFFWRSADDGDSWEFVHMVPPAAKKQSISFSEPTVTELPNGNFLAMMRTNGNLFSSISTDKGKTWGLPEDTKIKGYPAEMTVLPDGRILCVYGYRYAPMGIRACISRDNGKTWDIQHELIIRADGMTSNSGDLGYPKVAQIGNGEVFVVYYITTDGGMPYIAGTRFRVP